MDIYRLAPTNLPAKLQHKHVEPILMRLCKEIAVSYVPLTPVRFTPRYFETISCTRPMVYGVNDSSPRVRMRRDAQLSGRRMPTDRYQVIGG